MQRVILGKSYEEYVQKKITSGYNAYDLRLIHKAFRCKRSEDDFESKKPLRELAAESEKDLKKGGFTNYNGQSCLLIGKLYNII